MAYKYLQSYPQKPNQNYSNFTEEPHIPNLEENKTEISSEIQVSSGQL